MSKRIKRMTIVFSSAIILLFSNCGKIGNNLPDDIQGEWSKSSTYYYLTFEFTKNHVYYHDYASNTGASTDWDNDVSEIFDEESFKAGSYYYYYHVSGNTLHLLKDRTPLTLDANWWESEGHNGYGGYVLSRD